MVGGSHEAGDFGPDEARRFYDRLGARLDWQAVFENRAFDWLVAHAHFDRAERIVEFGCGTARLASRLFRSVLPPSATYLGLDVSPKMVALATERLRPFQARARVRLADGMPLLPEADGGADRCLATYVLDLLPLDDGDWLLADAARAVRPGGLLVVANLTHGATPLARAIERAWKRVHAWQPALLGGTRPMLIEARLGRAGWRLQERALITRLGLTSEVTIAARMT